MLVFGREPGQYVVIGDQVIVKVVKIKGDLKLAIEAPPEVSVVRGELYEKTHPRPEIVDCRASV